MQIILDLNYRIIDMDGSILAYLDIPKAFLLGRDFCSLIHEDVPEVVSEAFCASVREGRNHASVLKLKLSGSESWVGYRSSVRYEDGQFSEIALRLYEVEREVRVASQQVYDEMASFANVAASC